MASEPRVPYDDLDALRTDVHAAITDGRIRHNLRYIKSKGHVEIDRGIINAVLLHGRFQHDKESKDDRLRFNAYGQILGCTYKVVFEMWDSPEGRLVSVGSAYEVT